MHRGYIKLWRRSFDSSVWADVNLWRTWCCCLMLANYKDNWISVDGLAKPVKVSSGQFITGRYAFHQAMFPRRKKSNPSPITTWRWLKTLNSLGNLNIESNKRYSLITINNWHTYQMAFNENEQANDQAVINRRSSGDQAVITNKKDKKDKNVKNKEKNKTKKESFVFPDWLDLDVWSEYKKYRSNGKTKFTEYAQKLAINKLSKLKDEGNDPSEVIKQTIMMGWLGLFPIKDTLSKQQQDGWKELDEWAKQED